MLRASRLAALASGIATLAGGLNVHPHRLDHLDTQQIEDYTFDDFVRDFSRTYEAGTPEWESREATFQRNIQNLIEQRAYATSWTVGITKFMDYHDHEYNMLLGYKGRRQRGAYGPPPSNVSAFGGVDLPRAYDTTEGRPRAARVMDQGMCGSCWAAGAIGTLEAVVEATAPEIFEQLLAGAPQRHGLFDILSRKASARSLGAGAAGASLSMQEVVSCTQNLRNCGGSGGCDGATAELAYDMIKHRGLVASTAWPYSSGLTGKTGSCTASVMSMEGVPRLYVGGYQVLEPNKLLPLKEALYARGHPIAVVIDAQNWNFYRGGIYSDAGSGGGGDFTVNHEVALVGYQDPAETRMASVDGAESERSAMGYWRLKNSWGANWGESGFIRLEMKPNEQEHCGWDYDSHQGKACDGDPDRVWVCGTCGILYDSLYPTGVTVK